MLEIIHYDELVQEYNDSLNSVLRGFRPKYDFLELWVPDSDVVMSVTSLVETAALQGEKSLKIFLSGAILKNLDLKALENGLKYFGNVEQKVFEDGRIIYINKDLSSKDGTMDSVPALYQKKLAELSAEKTYQGSILEDGETLLIRSNKDGVSLFGAIDTSSHRIVSARFSGTNKPVESALLEALCAIIEGLPIQEAADHGLIKLEYTLRENAEKTLVDGIVNPFNYSEIFFLPGLLLRELYQTYIKKTDYQPSDNFYIPPVSKKWIELSDLEKKTKVIEAFGRLIKVEGKSYFDLNLNLQVVQIQGPKVFSAIVGDSDLKIKAKLYMDLERELRENVEASLQVFSENIQDLNSTRRLVQGA